MKCCHQKCRNVRLFLNLESKVKSWNPINCPCKLCKTYIEGVGYIWMMEQYTPRDKSKELIRHIGLL